MKRMVHIALHSFKRTLDKSMQRSIWFDFDLNFKRKHLNGHRQQCVSMQLMIWFHLQNQVRIHNQKCRPHCWNCIEEVFYWIQNARTTLRSSNRMTIKSITHLKWKEQCLIWHNNLVSEEVLCYPPHTHTRCSSIFNFIDFRPPLAVILNAFKLQSNHTHACIIHIFRLPEAISQINIINDRMRWMRSYFKIVRHSDHLAAVVRQIINYNFETLYAGLIDPFVFALTANTFCVANICAYALRQTCIFFLRNSLRLLCGHISGNRFPFRSSQLEAKQFDIIECTFCRYIGKQRTRIF